MAYQVKSFAFTIPAGTTKALPVTMDTPLGLFVVTSVEVDVPAGPNGNVGFRFTSGGTQMLPANLGAWFVMSGVEKSWPLSGQIESGAWQVQGYNTGIYDHTIQIRFLLDLLPGPGPAPDQPLLPVAAIMGELDGVTAGAGLEA